MSVATQQPTAQEGHLNAGLLAGMVDRVPHLLADSGPEAIAFVDVDAKIRAVHGYAKHATAFGYTRPRGLKCSWRRCPRRPRHR